MKKMNYSEITELVLRCGGGACDEEVRRLDFSGKFRKPINRYKRIS